MSGTRRLTTAQRGLGGPHQSYRQTALATMAEGQPCFRCELRGVVHPMTRAVIRRSPYTGRWVAPALELDDYPGRVFGGPQVKRLSWRKCNRSAGGTLGNMIKASRRPPAYTRW
jgi:hypothetical protein